MASNIALPKCKVIASLNSGWRKTMEDADIHQCDIGDGNALFGVFDGHGGTTLIIQDTKLVNTLKKFSLKLSRTTHPTKPRTINQQ